MILVKEENNSRKLSVCLILVLLNLQLSWNVVKCDNSFNDKHNNIISNDNVNVKPNSRQDVDIKINRFINDLKSGNSSRIIKSLTDLIKTVGLPAAIKNSDIPKAETREFKNETIASPSTEMRFYKSPFKKTLYYAKSIAKKAMFAYHTYGSELALGQCLFKYFTTQNPEIAKQITVKTVFGIAFKVYNAFKRFMLQGMEKMNAAGMAEQDEIGGKLADMTSEDFKNYFYNNKSNVGATSATISTYPGADAGYTYNTGNGVNVVGTSGGYDYNNPYNIASRNSQNRRNDNNDARENLLRLKRRIDFLNEIQFAKRKLMSTSRNNNDNIRTSPAATGRSNDGVSRARQARQYDYQSPTGSSGSTATTSLNYNLNSNDIDNSYPPPPTSPPGLSSVSLSASGEQPTEFVVDSLFNVSNLFGKNGWAVVDFQSVILEHFGLSKPKANYPLFKCAQVYGFNLFWKKIEEFFFQF